MYVLDGYGFFLPIGWSNTADMLTVGSVEIRIVR